MKKLQFIHQSTGMHWVGNGFPVRSVFSYAELGRELDPFLLLDYAAPYEFAPGEGKRGVGAHPHQGFETVTISYQGEVAHRDSEGGRGVVGPGDVQWMTAASGLFHEEFHSEAFTRSGGTFQMVQLWVNLPAKDKNATPRYQTLLKETIPTVELPDGAGRARIIAGQLLGTSGPAETFTEINLWDLYLEPGKAVQIPVPHGHTAALLVMKGSALAGPEGKAIGEGDLAVFETAGDLIYIQAREESHLLFLGGERLNEPIAGRGPFVMNTEAELFEAYQKSRSYNLSRLFTES